MAKVIRLRRNTHNSPRVEEGVPDKLPFKYDAETARLMRQVLERVAQNIERHSNRMSPSYFHAYKNAARIVRRHKPD